MGTKPRRKNNDKGCINKMQVDLQVCKLRDIKTRSGQYSCTTRLSLYQRDQNRFSDYGKWYHPLSSGFNRT